ncbi:MAG: hypothetical protein G01um101431_564 [Parcubacteria group bacterium Gr01-1014_31]|nr:MAG: hypothetical protein G01um101431_564 [Parcubacteria group bacterium Gr01-1014_31]
MAHSAVIAYLRANKDRFPEAVLREQLAAQGYPPAVIAAGMAEVYGPATAKTPATHPQRFFGWRVPFTYRSSGQRVRHFLLGLLLGGVLSLVFSLLNIFLNRAETLFVGGGLFALRIGLLAFFFWRWPWLGWGLLAATVLWHDAELRFINRFIFGYGYW